MPLTASQRLSLLRTIAERLQDEKWSLVDVTLQQFGLPTADSWNGTIHDYVLHLVKGASDQVLIELAQHVGFSLTATAKPRIEPVFWQKDMLRVFVCHLAANKSIATEVQTALLNYGISCFIAHKDIEPTAEWLTEIELALATCDALVAMLHDGFHKSNWTDQEIGFAMGRGVPVFSVRFGQDPYGFIGRFQAFDGGKKEPKLLALELFHAYRKHKQTQEKMSEVLMRLFELSGSFADAKLRIGYLEDLTLWDPSFVARLQAAPDRNSQISAAHGVPERVAKLAAKWEGRSA